MNLTLDSKKCTGFLEDILSWGCTNKNHIVRIQTFQNKMLSNILNPPRYIRVSDLHRDIDVEMDADIRENHVNSHKNRVKSDINVEASRLMMSRFTFRRLNPVELTSLNN